MKKAIFAIGLLFALSSISHAAIVDNSHITVTGTVQPGYSAQSTIDDKPGTFWHGVNDLTIGQVDYLAYHFANTSSINPIDFYDNYTNHYQMGELAIQISSNTTDGWDGTWSTILHVNGDYNPPNGDWIASVLISNTEWVRLYMTYQGRGAHGGSPAFYLSEVDFQGSVTPEPSSLLLLGFGLFGIGLFKRKKQ